VAWVSRQGHTDCGPIVLTRPNGSSEWSWEYFRLSHSRYVNNIWSDDYEIALGQNDMCRQSWTARHKDFGSGHSSGLWVQYLVSIWVNPLTPNGTYRGRTAPITSKRCILYIYSSNIVTEYFKHGINSPFFLKRSWFHNYNIFGSCIIHILYTECAKIKKIIPAPKG